MKTNRWFVVTILWVLPLGKVHSQSEIFRFHGDPDSRFGFDVAGGASTNGDTVPDMLVGAPFTGASHDGAATVYSGLDGSPLLQWNGGSASQFGHSVEFLDDIDSDGTADIAVGAPEDSHSGSPAGSVWIYSGTGAFLRVHDGPRVERPFGHDIARLGDLDFDGIGDYAISMPNDIDGCVFTYSGATGKELFRVDGPVGYFGYSIAGIGDINGDGRAELLVGAPADSANTGLVIICSGLNGTFLDILVGGGGNSALGFSVDGIPDINQDGIDDVLAGAPFENSRHGALRLFSGKDGSLLRHTKGSEVDSLLGHCVSALGDFNGDGVGDYAAGSPFGARFGTIGTPGTVSIFSGKTGNLLYVLEGNEDDDLFGFSLDAGGFVDADSLSDIVVGAPDANSSGSNLGAASVFSGNDLILLISPHVSKTNSIVNFQTREGTPGAPIAVFLVSIDAVPVNFMVSLAMFDSEGSWVFSPRIPNNLPTHTLELQSFALDPTGSPGPVIIDSNRELLVITK